MQQAVPDHVGQRQVVVVGGGDPREFPLQEKQVIEEGTLDGGFVQAGANGVARQFRLDRLQLCIHVLTSRKFPPR
jgi:hypothetical protein